MLPTTLHDVTAIITFHREALLAHKSLLSLQRCRMAANSAGISLEVVATLDRADEETTRIVHSHLANGCVDRVLHLDCGDLGLSRNQAVLASSGARILICDGDDYLSADFLIRCHQRAEALPGSAILHPELIVTFEAETGLWWQTGSDAVDFDPACMLTVNPWNACSFARREIYLELPYAKARPGESGFGFEDWHWNCETYARGHAHVIAERTVHYVRKKRSGSLNNAHASQNALIPPTRLFDLQ
ncbi:glycosyltransferase family A protein [Stenotrophomonas sp. TD3]|uniref:glycosyltransferase family A protein n=1 Tax=Stenotrophomonas sp. TD3 TaxID=1641707 RepID=UPI0009517FDD|nr:glycosyltransferase family A protein [Stenotrophomonas sp. TD3]